MDKTKIDWCDSTWNPVTGCLHDCEYCYARGISNRFSTQEKNHSFYGGHPIGKIHELDEMAVVTESGRKSPYPFGFEPTFHRYRLEEYKDKKGRNIFVCSMADLFGEWVPDEWIYEVFEACDNAPQHNYLFLTKNPKRYINLDLPNTDNLWYGTSICQRSDIPKCRYFLFGRKNYVSIEPILEDLGNLRFYDEPIARYVDWMIVGAETGKRKENVVPEREWIESLVTECRNFNIPIFMKSSLAEIWGEPIIQEFPEELKRGGKK